MRDRAAALLIVLLAGGAIAMHDPPATAAAAPCTGVAATDAHEAACGRLLPAGLHVVVWERAATPIATAFATPRLGFAATPPREGAQAVDYITVLGRQQADGTRRAWAMGVPPGAMTLQSFEPGETYWLIVSTDLQLSFGRTHARSVLEGSRVVSFYGHPGVPVMGVLGEYARATDAAAGVEEWLARYRALSAGRPVIGALHLIVDVANTDAGYDGSYLGRMPLEAVAPFVEATRARGQLLFLDVQIGWSDPLREVQRLEPLLREPHVHVALDPEFATLGKGEPPGQAIGFVTAEQVNAVQRYLAGLAAATGAPKVLVVHQFRSDMIHGATGLARVEDVDLVIDMDGWGPPAQKIGGYAAFATASYAPYAGFKLFFRWDQPLLSPEDVMAFAHPPDYVIYQ